MTATAIHPDRIATASRASWTLWLRSRWASIAVLSPLLVLAGPWQYIGMAGAPQRIDDEGTYVAQAYAVQTFHSLGHYTYWYDHPPLGWIQLAAYTWATDAFGREPNAVLAGREAMLFFQLVSCVLLWVLCRRLILSRWASGLAVALFSLSPLAVQFHRTVYLDNIATPWILASLLLALTAQRRLSAYGASALCFAVAVLTKETSLLLLPAVAYLLWRATGAAGTRRYALSLAASVFTLTGCFYVLYAVIKAELVPGANHVSLVNGIKFQLFTRQGSGSIFTSGTLSYDHLHQWLQLDTVFPVVSVLCLIPALVVSRLRPIAVAYAVLLVTMLRPGYLPVPYLIAMLPFAAVVVAGVADAAATWVPARYKTRAASRWRIPPLLPVVLVAALVVGVLGAPDWVSQQRGCSSGRWICRSARPRRGSRATCPTMLGSPSTTRSGWTWCAPASPATTLSGTTRSTPTRRWSGFHRGAGATTTTSCPPSRCAATPKRHLRWRPRCVTPCPTPCSAPARPGWKCAG